MSAKQYSLFDNRSYHPCDDIRRYDRYNGELMKAKAESETAKQDLLRNQQMYADLKYQMDKESKVKDEYRRKSEMLETELSYFKERFNRLQNEQKPQKKKPKIQMEEIELERETDESANLSTLSPMISFNDGLIRNYREEQAVNRRYIEQLAELTQDREDLRFRLQMAEEHLGEIRRDYQILEEQSQDLASKLIQLQIDNEKAESDLREVTERANTYKKLYETYKEQVNVEMIRKDGTIAQQEKLITYLQCQLANRKKSCCRSQREKEELTQMQSLAKTIDLERSKNLLLERNIRQLKQELAERLLTGGDGKQEPSQETVEEPGTKVISEEI